MLQQRRQLGYYRTMKLQVNSLLAATSGNLWHPLRRFGCHQIIHNLKYVAEFNSPTQKPQINFMLHDKYFGCNVVLSYELTIEGERKMFMNQNESQSLWAKLSSAAIIALNRLCRDNGGKRRKSHSRIWIWKQTSYLNRHDSGVVFSECQVLLWLFASFRAEAKRGFV